MKLRIRIRTGNTVIMVPEKTEREENPVRRALWRAEGFSQSRKGIFTGFFRRSTGIWS
jgi:hypothetical protein